MIEDKDIPDPRKMAILEYTHNNDIRNSLDGYGLSDYFATYNHNAIGNKLKRATNWGENNYTYGVPKANLIVEGSVNLPRVMVNFLANTLGINATVRYAVLRPTNNGHMTYQILTNQYGYDMSENTFNYSGRTVYLKDVEIVYCADTIDNIIDPDTLNPLGYSPASGKTPFRLEDRSRVWTEWRRDASASKDYAVITYCYSVPGEKESDPSKEVTGTFTLDFLAYEYSGVQNKPEVGEGADVSPITDDASIERDYVMVGYTTTAGKLGTFTYEHGSGNHPVLDRMYDSEDVINYFAPNIYFRLMGNDLTEDVHKNTDEYKSSIKLCKRLGLNWLAVADELNKNIESMKDVSQMFITTCIPANTESTRGREYLYAYFDNLYRLMPNSVPTTEYSDLRKNFLTQYAKGGMTIDIKDRVYTSRISFKSIGYTDVIGSIGEVGTVTGGLDTLEVRKRVNGSVFPREIIDLDFHSYRKQISPTVYREIIIYGLTSTQVVKGGHSTTASGDDENLMIPLDQQVLRGMGIDKNKLISESLHIVFNTLKVVKKKWYESGIFKAIMFVVAVFISLWTGGAGITLYTVLYAVVQTIVVGAILNLAIKFMVNKLGINVGTAFAVVAVIALLAGGYSSISKTSVAGLTSQQLVAIANQSFNISNNGYQIEMVNLQQEFIKSGELHMEKMEELQKEIEATGITKAISSPLYLMSPLVTQSSFVVGETPANFFTRTLSCDANLATLSMIDNYVDLSVQLPTFIGTYYGAQQDELG